MDRAEFREEIFAFFNRGNNESLKQSYDLAFTVKEPIDWDKLYRLVITSAESRYLPSPKWFLDFFPQCIKREDNNYTTPDGLKVKLTLNDGYSYEFETYHLSYTLEEIKQKFMKKYRDKFKSLSLFDEEQLEWVIF